MMRSPLLLGLVTCVPGLVAWPLFGNGMGVPTRRAVLERGCALVGSVWAAAASAANTEAPTATAPAAALVEETSTAAVEAVPLATPQPSVFDFDVPFRGEPRDINPFLGQANILVNVKFDDPQTLDQMPALTSLVSRYASSGLHILAFPTDQGWFEAEDSNTLRLKFKSVYDFGQFPTAVVFDKSDLLGANALPLYAWLTAKLINPWGVTRLVFNYEKFLVDASGQPLRRYPRRFPVQLMEADVRAVLAGLELPPPSAQLTQAWVDAKREAIKSEYSFKPGLNYYSRGSPAS